MKQFKAGEKVIFHTGSMGSEQGQMYPSWWPYDEIVTIISVVDDKALVELEQGERKWTLTKKLERPGEVKKEEPVLVQEPKYSICCST